MTDAAPRAPESFRISVAAAAVTRDGGRSFAPLRVPKAAIARARHAEPPGIGGPRVAAAAGEVGMIVGGMARLGWDPADDTSAGD